MNIKINAKIHAYTPARLTDNIVRWKKDKPTDESRIQLTKVTVVHIDEDVDAVKFLSGKSFVLCSDNVSFFVSEKKFIGNITFYEDSLNLEGFIVDTTFTSISKRVKCFLQFEYLW